jgi:menaquinone-dependent protoporphyrinogen oxidase
MAKVLAVYGTRYGQTRRIVERIGKVLGSYGHDVLALQGDQIPSDFSLEGFDGFLIAASVRYGKHQPYIQDFVRRNVALLSRKPAAFISVCGAIAGQWEPGPAEAKKYLENFVAETGWAPSFSASVAGAVAYTKYGFLTRRIMQLISARTGRPTDTSRDWDFTDWDQVDQLGMELADRLAGSLAPLEQACST